MNGSVVYEVNLDLESEIEVDYRAWLATHVAEILALPGFLRATVFDVVDPLPAEGRVSLCVQYLLRDEAALQEYFDRHAVRLRGDGLARFDGRFNATRRVLRR